MWLNKQANLKTVDHLVIKNKPINIIDDFKYLGSYVFSTEHDMQVRIGVASPMQGALALITETKAVF